jgi:hypothetical protein
MSRPAGAASCFSPTLSCQHFEMSAVSQVGMNGAARVHGAGAGAAAVQAAQRIGESSAGVLVVTHPTSLTGIDKKGVEQAVSQ